MFLLVFFSLSAAQYARDFVFSIVVGKDMIPRYFIHDFFVFLFLFVIVLCRREHSAAIIRQENHKLLNCCIFYRRDVILV